MILQGGGVFQASRGSGAAGSGGVRQIRRLLMAGKEGFMGGGGDFFGGYFCRSW